MWSMENNENWFYSCWLRSINSQDSRVSWLAVKRDKTLFRLRSKIHNGGFCGRFWLTGESSGRKVRLLGVSKAVAREVEENSLGVWSGVHLLLSLLAFRCINFKSDLCTLQYMYIHIHIQIVTRVSIPDVTNERCGTSSRQSNKSSVSNLFKNLKTKEFIARCDLSHRTNYNLTKNPENQIEQR